MKNIVMKKAVIIFDLFSQKEIEKMLTNTFGYELSKAVSGKDTIYYPLKINNECIEDMSIVRIITRDISISLSTETYLRLEYPDISTSEDTDYDPELLKIINTCNSITKIVEQSTESGIKEFPMSHEYYLALKKINDCYHTMRRNFDKIEYSISNGLTPKNANNLERKQKNENGSYKTNLRRALVSRPR